MARKHIMHPTDGEENLVQSGENQTVNQKDTTAKTNTSASSIPSTKDTKQDK
jgi:hypothetical protein